MSTRGHVRSPEDRSDVETKENYVAVTYDMAFVRQIAHTVTVLHQGTVLCEGPVEQVQQDPRVLEVYLGQSGRPTRDAAEAAH